MTRARALLLRCPAKVNLHLEVRGRRPDGYHELRTLFAAVGIWDDLEVEEAPAGVLELAVEPAGSAGVDEDNLVVRAARALQARMEVPPGARLRLAKRIPVSGGMGGGSSDAAAALVGLAHLWGQPSDFGTLAPVAATLGADVPYFLVGGLAWATGRGDQLSPLPDGQTLWLVVLPGPDPVPTAEVYRRLTVAGLDESAATALYQWTVNGGELPFAACRNDLEAAVVTGWPEVGERLAAIRATGPLLGLVSGSGGTVFGVFGSAVEAETAARRLEPRRSLVAALLTREASRARPLEGESAWRSPRFAST